MPRGIKWPWEVGGADTSTDSRREGRNAVVNLPSWVRNALRLKSNEVPSNLLTPDIGAHLDIFQNGWGTDDSEFEVATATQPASTGLQFFILYPSPIVINRTDVEVTRRLICMSISHVGGVAAGDVQIAIRRIVGGVAFAAIQYSVFSLAVGALFGMEQLFPSGNVIVVPPGWEFGVAIPATGVGESYVISSVAIRMPAGFNPT